MPTPTLQGLQSGADVLFLLVGAVLVFAMHGGFAFLEAGTVRHKNQVNALCKILVDFAISTVAYFFIGYTIAYGVAFFAGAQTISGGGSAFGPQGLTLVKFFFLCTFAAAVPAIISGGIAERARFLPQCVATALIVALFYPFFEGIVWNKNHGLQETFFKARFGEEFTTSPAPSWCTRWAAGSPSSRRAPLAALARPLRQGRTVGIPPSSIPWLAMGSWLLHRLVRLQRDERAVAAVGERPGRSQLADGRAAASLPRSSPATAIRASFITVRWRASSRYARAPT
jgi:Amt family ammonium transporter